MFGVGVDRAIRAHALAEYPRECCGLVSGSLYVPLQNVAANPFAFFQIPARAMLDHAPVEAIIHSHCDGHPKEPSPADYANQKLTRVAVYGLVWTDGKITSDLIWFGDGIDAAHDRTARRAQG